MSWYKVIRFVIGSFIRIFIRTRVVGRENIPENGAFIVAVGSHTTHIEPVLLAMALAPHEPRFLAKSELWSNPVNSWLMNNTGQVPVARLDHSRARGAIDAGVVVLRNGDIIAVYPEGSFSSDGRVHRGHKGAALMAAQAGVPIIPIGMTGMEKVNPSGWKLRPGHVTFSIGKPIYPECYKSFGDTHDEQAARTMTEQLMKRIAVLSEKEYDDTYLAIPSHGK